jgi:tetratricopeptide (TPR) repeat protein
LLDQQFFDNPQFYDYLKDHYVLLHVDAADARGEVLFDRYDINSTPSVLLARPDGREIDRMIGFDVSAQEYKDSLDSLRQGTDTLLSVLESYENNPTNLELAAVLAKKYHERYAFTKMRTYSQIVLSRSQEARQLMIVLDANGVVVSAYEFARYTSAYDGAEEVLDFLTEFPESPLKDAAFRNLSWYLSRSTDAERVLAVYDALLERHPYEAGLLAPLIEHYERVSMPKEGIGHAEALQRVHPEEFDPSLRKTYASLLIMDGDAEKALDIYGPSLAETLLQGDDYRPLNDYAWFWATRGRNLESALDAAERALAMRDAANIWDTLSMVYRKMGRLEDALSAEERAVRLSEGRIARYKERLEEIRDEIAGH